MSEIKESAYADRASAPDEGRAALSELTAEAERLGMYDEGRVCEPYLTKSGADATRAWECVCGRLMLLSESKCDECGRPYVLFCR